MWLPRLLLVFVITVTTCAASLACDTSDWMEPDGSLRELLSNDKLSFIFVGGKGGVGKTTTSSALAIQLARSRRAAGDAKDVLLISTDPAHSLGDAFKQQFSGKPTAVQGVEGLKVMEVDPAVLLAKETKSWAKIVKKAGHNEMAGELSKLQSWLTSIPGIDEATALAHVVNQLDKGTYSAIVFDTAPTGHTLKLLALPDVLEVGLSRLQGWSTKLWGYYQSFAAFFKDPNDKSDPNMLRKKLERKLRMYKKGIMKVSKMLKDNKRTSFVTVCIAEHLSISESRRLLRELRKSKVHSNHIVVNQLVQGALGKTELAPLEAKGAAALASAIGVQEDVAARLLSSARLSQAREAIQSKYLAELRDSDEAKCLDIVTLPLLPAEVTGPDALSSFSELLVKGKGKSNEREANTAKDEL